MYANSTRTPVQRQWDVRVLYVQAQGSPYHALDQGIEDALRSVAREVHIAGPEDNVAAIAENLRPDLVLVLDAIGRSFPTDQADAMRAKGIRTAIWLPDDPYHSDQTIQLAPHYDYVFTLEQSCVQLYKDHGCKTVHHLPFAVNPEFTRYREVDTAYTSDICFIGSAFWNRVALFDELADYLSGKNFKIIGWWWDRMQNYEKLKNKIHGFWLSPEETAKHYSGAKIVINMHRSAEDASHNRNSKQIPANSVNPRLFEISACATLQLVDERPELANLYTPGVDIVSFQSADDLRNKIEYYLTHEEERREIVRKSLFRTVNEHTYRNRLSRLLELVFG
jgi:spore maturation protein CgeB